MFDETKAHYNQFIDKNGEIISWFRETGLESMVNQASNQISASNGKPIKWVFEEKEFLLLVKREFERKGFTSIIFEFKPMK